METGKPPSHGEPKHFPMGVRGRNLDSGGHLPLGPGRPAPAPCLRACVRSGHPGQPTDHPLESWTLGGGGRLFQEGATYVTLAPPPPAQAPKETRKKEGTLTKEEAGDCGGRTPLGVGGHSLAEKRD